MLNPVVYHPDPLGGAYFASDSGGIVHCPYGYIRRSSGILGALRKFTGQYLDGSGLYFYNARYYDPGLGRFVSPDSIVPDPANPQAWNRYSYVVNNPLRYKDPTGHCWWGGSRNWWGCGTVRQATAAAKNAVVDLIVPEQGTRGVQVNAAVQFPVYVNVQAAVVIDEGGQVGFAASVTTGGSTGVGGSLGSGFAYQCG